MPFASRSQPQGTFTHAAAADYDGDGRLDLYLCLTCTTWGSISITTRSPTTTHAMAHLTASSTTKALTFVETTAASGMNAENNRYSFACAWGDSGDGLPDLFVANDFGSSQLYRNDGNGHFTHRLQRSDVEGVGAGMSCCWCDYDNDGQQDVYVPSMWEAAGQRVSSQAQFHARGRQRFAASISVTPAATPSIAIAATAHLKTSATRPASRWAVGPGAPTSSTSTTTATPTSMSPTATSLPDREDLASFFWRQIVAKSSEDATPQAYERGWNAINELVRSDHTWHGYARNVFFANHRDGTFSEASGAGWLDFIEDSRSFALTDIDHDGRLEIVLKNRNAPQLRVLHNTITGIGASICFRLRGVNSNRDAIGASVTVETGITQTKYLQAGSGFLAQHSKELFFGVGDAASVVAPCRWPNGLVQTFQLLARRSIALPSRKDRLLQATPFRPALGSLMPAPPARASPLQCADMAHRALYGARILSCPIWMDPCTRSAPGATPALLIFWSSPSPRVSISSADCRTHRCAGRASHASPSTLTTCIRPPHDSSPRKSTSRSPFSSPRRPPGSTTSSIAISSIAAEISSPAALLLDGDSIIVKVYQGPVDPDYDRARARRYPRTAADRLHPDFRSRGILAGGFQRNIFTFGVAFYQHGYLSQAAETFRQVIADKPDDADARYNLGTLSLRRHDYDKARSPLQQTVKLRPDYPEAWNNLGMIAAGQSDRPTTRSTTSCARSSFDPTTPSRSLNLGNLYRHTYLRQGRRMPHRALELRRMTGGQLQYWHALRAARTSRSRQRSICRQHPVLRPDYPEALNNLGIVFVRQGDYAHAEEEFKTGIRLLLGFDQSWLNLARLYALQNDRERARQVLNQLSLQPDNANAKKPLEQLQMSIRRGGPPRQTRSCPNRRHANVIARAASVPVDSVFHSSAVAALARKPMRTWASPNSPPAESARRSEKSAAGNAAARSQQH